MTNSGGILTTWLLGSLSPVPRYLKATRTLLTFSVLMFLLSGMNAYYLWNQNKKKKIIRVTSKKDEEKPGLGDLSAWFEYALWPWWWYRVRLCKRLTLRFVILFTSHSFLRCYRFECTPRSTLHIPSGTFEHFMRWKLPIFLGFCFSLSRQESSFCPLPKDWQKWYCWSLFWCIDVVGTITWSD